jgi:hypothetical protein
VFFSGESLCPHSGTPIEQERWRFGAWLFWGNVARDFGFRTNTRAGVNLRQCTKWKSQGFQTIIDLCF